MLRPRMKRVLQRLRSMWTRRRSQLVIIRIHLKRGLKLTIPVPLYILDILLRALNDLLLLASAFMPLAKKSARQDGACHSPSWRRGIAFVMAGDLTEELLWELRKRGRWRLVEAAAGDCAVSIDFY